VVRDAVRSVIEMGVTVLVITHDKAMMRVAERICVVGRGRVVEEGSWDELMGKDGGEFRRLVGGESLMG
jgi:ATP-binding cassette subfamily B (MDR/TAP) protein 1